MNADIQCPAGIRQPAKRVNGLGVSMAWFICVNLCSSAAKAVFWLMGSSINRGPAIPRQARNNGYSRSPLYTPARLRPAPLSLQHDSAAGNGRTFTAPAVSGYDGPANHTRDPA